MRMTLFLSIMHKLNKTSLCFSKRYDATGHVSLTLLQKCTVVVHQLAYDMTINMIDGYLNLGELIALECLKYYYSDIIECFGAKFLRHPTIDDTQCLLGKAEERGFFSILGSIDCMYW
jgi:hypothetical protein